MVQQVKDPALSLQWLGFDPCPGNFHMPWVEPKKKQNPQTKTNLQTLNSRSGYRGNTPHHSKGHMG